MILISDPHVACQNNIHTHTHKHTHTHTHTQLQPHPPHSHNVWYSTSLSHLTLWATVVIKLCQKCRFARKSALMCFLQLPQHTTITSLNNTNPFVSTLHTELSVKCKLNCYAAFKWRSQRVLSSEVSRPGRIVDRSYPSGSEFTNEWSYISTPIHMFSRSTQARPLPSQCLTTDIAFNDSTLFTSSYHVSNF